MKKDSEGLVQIGKDRGVSRRGFLKGLGASAALGVAGCADDHKQHVLPYVKGEDEQIPGVAVWYKSTCSECTAGCGIMVRTREGRAIKIEGDPSSPINKGGLCALGQSAVQGLYDPDRVREPLARERGSDASGRTVYSFGHTSWDSAVSKIAPMIKGGDKKKALITGELSGSQANLVATFCSAFGVEHVSWDPVQPTSLKAASKAVYGIDGIPSFKIDKADFVLNLGADFLETWISPVEFARGWADSRRGDKKCKFVHVEPRLSLSGANADLWLSCKPGSETELVKYLIKELLQAGRGQSFVQSLRAGLISKIKGGDLTTVSLKTGIESEKIALVLQNLREASAPLVLAGGTAASVNGGAELQTLVAILNGIVGAIGKTVDLASLRDCNTSLEKVVQLLDGMKKGEYETVIVAGTNAAFTLPSSFGFDQARNMVPNFVVISMQLDETAELANLVLPLSSSLESWGDVVVKRGVFGLQQPTMRPVFDSKSLGDILIAIATAAGSADVFGGATSFESYLKESWKKIYEISGQGVGFDRFWLESLERGGFLSNVEEVSSNVSLAADALAALGHLSPTDHGELHSDVSKGKLHVYPYFSVHAFDGRSANRPWLQEIPDPLTTAVWNSWVEIHPDTAHSLGLDKNDMVTVRNEFGEVNLPVYLTPYVRKDIVAMPIGQGHTALGRYAKEVSAGGNVLNLIPPVVTANGAALNLLSTVGTVTRGRGKSKLLILQGSDSEGKRGIGQAETVMASASAAKLADRLGHDSDHAGGHGGHGDGHHEIKQMYTQREHPVYSWGLSVDLAACTGCSACVVACYAENNIPVVGKAQVYKGREMSWLRIERYYDGSADELQVNFVPMMCQHCNNAPCEPVCPVYATYHNEEGLNAMIYNRCVGTRYCSNNCSYKVRRFNWFEYETPEPLSWQLNPDVTRRGLGVMEKCTFCVQRIAEAKDRAKDLGRLVQDGEVTPACVQSCPTKALSFGNLNDPKSEVSIKAHDARGYKILDKWINTQPAVSYLKRVRVEI